MKVTLAIALREAGSYFRQPAGWIIIALSLFLSGLIFAAAIMVPGKIATLRDFFALSGWLLLPVAPAISMRLLAEELRAGTIENLLTAPITMWSLVVGKYLGASLFLAAMLVPSLVYPLILVTHANPTPPMTPIIAGYVCLMLLGLLYLAIGLLASSLTSNATLAFIATLFAILALIFASLGAQSLPEPFSGMLNAIAIGPRIMDFSRGIIDTAHIAYFLFISAAFVILSALVMEVRRWK